MPSVLSGFFGKAKAKGKTVIGKQAEGQQAPALVVEAAVAANSVMVFSKSYCPYCKRVAKVLSDAFGKGGLTVMELDLRPDGDALQDELLTRTGGRSVPRVFISGEFVGGCDDVVALAREGKLKGLLKAKPEEKRPAVVRDIEDESDIEKLNLSCGCKGAPKMPDEPLPIVGDEGIMSRKGHGTTDRAVMDNLRYGCDWKVADRICSFNRHYAEHSGYFKSTSWLKEVGNKDGPTTYYDSVTGLPLFTAPIGRTFEEFQRESAQHGWPSFRDQEVHWENVRCLPDGECVSTAGTHLGHNLPRGGRNRYCINLVSVAGRPANE